MFIDDILKASATPGEHHQHLGIAFERLQLFGLYINVFEASTVNYLGYQIDEHGLKPQPEKVAAIRDYQKTSIFGAAEKIPGNS